VNLRALIADDEPLARARLRRLLGKQRDIHVVEECASGRATLEALCRRPIDLLFLDIELPEFSGFEVIERAGGSLPATIFVTAYSEHALRAFDVSAVDYLVKPIDGDRLVLAVQRARQRLDNPRTAAYLERIPVRSGTRIRFVHVDDIDYLEAQGNYIAVFGGEREELIRDTLTAMETKLDPKTFVRIHRRFIVRRSRIVELEPLPGGEFVVTLASGKRLLSGRTYRPRLTEIARL
jgi:two-component system, LytTR family, response regulator